MKALAQFLVVLALAIAAPSVMAADDASAETAELGQYLTSHGYGIMKVEVGDNNRQVLRARTDGQGVSLLIDTGFSHTSLSASCARHLKLVAQETNLTTFGVGGAVSGKIGLAPISSFTLDGYEINRTNVINVLPKAAHVDDVDGYFGFDFLRANAVLLPVGARIILFKPGRNGPPPIDHFMNLLGYTAIPLTYAGGGLCAEEHLNGQPLTALIDCGAALSSFDLNYVKSIPGANATLIANFEMSGVDGRKSDAYGFTPKNLEIGSLAIRRTELAACPMPVFSHTNYNALLGYDVLASHGAIIDLGHETLWMK